MSAHLEVREGQRTRDVPLTRGTTQIGRGPTCDVQIDDSAASRIHCQILRTATGYRLEDLDSRNGTSVNGIRCRTFDLTEGDRLEIGQAQIVFRSGGPIPSPLEAPGAESDPEGPIAEALKFGVRPGSPQVEGPVPPPALDPGAPAPNRSRETGIRPPPKAPTRPPTPKPERKKGERAPARSKPVTDPLTGLLSREEIEKALPHYGRDALDGKSATLVAIDLDDFREVNHSLGRGAGDAIVYQIARCMEKHAAAPEGTMPPPLAGRISGVRFAVVWPGVSETEARPKLAALLEDLSKVRVSEVLPPLNASCGVAENRPEPETGAAWLFRVEQAVAAAKRRGRGLVENWTPALAERARGLESVAPLLSGDFARDLGNVGALVDIITAAGSEESLERLLARTLDRVLEITGTERGMIWLAREEEPSRKGGEPGGSGESGLRMPKLGASPAGGLEMKVARAAGGQPLTSPVAFSQSALDRVLSTGRPVCVMETGGESTGERSPSMQEFELLAVMAVPLAFRGRTVGMIYVDSHAATRRFAPADLLFLQAIADQAAVAIENFQYAARKRAQETERRRRLEEENVSLRLSLADRHPLLGDSPAMQRLRDAVQKVAPTDATVLIHGPTGTGKEAVAHTIHHLSPRHEKPFVVVDCAAIPATLLESELFGHEKGAFTGADRTKVGRCEQAQGGTLFLDEIGELPLPLQAKFLRFLQERQVVRVGGIKPIAVDLRILAATNADLEALVKEEKFREDLFFRVKVVSLETMPLTERGQDVLLLARHFLERFNTEHGGGFRGFTEEAKDALLRHAWPGNVRELMHRIEQAVILGEGEQVTARHLGLDKPSGQELTLESARDEFEKQFLEVTLARHRHNVTHAAKALDVSRQHLQNLMKKYSLRTESREG